MLGRIFMGATALILGACSVETTTAVGNAPAQMLATARSACQAYGIEPYTARFERCVRNELAARAQG
jgi:hypothetical protein